ncbi:MAG: NTP transferase domain-containing protein, partial [Pirellulales bacterium]|nr:NTP transferase domain-containing protein [Pirellulales bacterium]
MKSSIRTTIPDVRPLREATQIGMGKVLNPQVARDRGDFGVDHPALVILAAGKGTRFGRSPKCAQAICGMPLGRHSIEAFRCISQSPAVCVVGYCHEEVMAALGEDNLYVLSDCPTGGTAFAAYEALSFPELVDANALLVITMGDRIVTESIFEKLVQTHLLGPREADLTLLTAIYEVPKHHGKGRLVRDSNHRVLRIIEQRDIDTMHDSPARQRLQETTEGNCPLYAIRAETLNRHLSSLTNQNAQGQYYFTDIVETISREGGDIRTITTTTADPEYDLLCSDVTRPMDLALLEGILASARSAHRFQPAGVDDVARAICAGRPAGQVAAIAAQLDELTATAARDELGYRDDQPVGIGVSGGRLRIAFMHPDMGRFFGPAWQMPFGAKNASGREQIVIVVQSSDDGEIHLYPAEPQFRERLNSVAADTQCMYPGDEIADWYSYEDFGTRMAENILLSLGYFTDDELASRREQGLPLPPASLWLANSMRRPFSLIGNAIASMRTLREGNLGAKVQTYLGRDGFRGLRVMSTGNIPQGGFSSSSAVTVAVKNAINALFDLGISPDMLVHLACQAEYGTGVRAGALDQATEQKGRLKQGTLISSNPRENYRILGTYPVPTDRFHVLFVYSVDRDRVAWRWSAGTYAESPEPGRLTTAQMRKMTGKASELAAILTRLPLDTDYFQRVEDDLLTHGQLGKETTSWVCDQLKQIPLHATRDDLRAELRTCRRWYVEQLANVHRMSAGAAGKKADATIEALFSGWRDPLLLRTTPAGEVVEENGIPLRAIVAYLFGEVAKNFYLIFHPDAWITCISQSQNGDRCFAIDPGLLPPCDAMKQTLDWESGASGPTLMERWLDRFGATPFDFNRGLDDEALSADPLPSFHRLEGSNFFRGLALVDLAEAMLKRAFGSDAVAVRINAA